MVEQTEPAYELIYWGGNFAGRGEYIRLLLEVCGQPYTDTKDKDTLLAYYRGEVLTTHPVIFAPYLKHNGTIFSQLPACLLYIASNHGLVPDDPIDAAHAM